MCTFGPTCVLLASNPFFYLQVYFLFICISNFFSFFRKFPMIHFLPTGFPFGSGLLYVLRWYTYLTGERSLLFS